MKTTVVITRTTVENPLEHLEVVKIGDTAECKAFLFELTFPSSLNRNFEKLPYEDGYAFKIERFYGNKWNGEIYHMIYHHED